MKTPRTIELVVVVRRRECHVLSSGWCKPVSRWLLREPFLSTRNDGAPPRHPALSPFQKGDAELEVRLLDRHARELAAYAWRDRPQRWIDAIPRDKGLRARRGYVKASPGKDIRTWRIPVAPGTASLSIRRNEVVASSRGKRVRTTELNSYRLRPPRPDRRHPGWEAPPISRRRDGRDPEWWHHRQGTGGKQPHGHTLPPAPLAPGVRPKRTGYDIVLTGDGYTKAELGRFIDQAQRLRAGLRRIKPFDSRSIRWHILPAASEQSGVETSRSHEKRTYYETFCMMYRDGRIVGFVPTRLRRFLHGTRKVGPWALIDLVIVIANHHTHRIGGHAWPDLKVVVIPHFDKRHTESYARLAAHEAAHAMGCLADEWPVGDLEDRLDPAPNRAPLCQVASSVKAHVERIFAIRFGQGGRPAWDTLPDTIWWRDLLPGHPSHLPVNIAGEPLPWSSPSWRAAQVGAVWGCERLLPGPRANRLTRELATLIAGRRRPKGSTDRGSRELVLRATLPQGAQEGDKAYAARLHRVREQVRLRGMAEFRPTALCLMNAPGLQDFCPVCGHVLREIIGGRCSHADWARRPVPTGLPCLDQPTGR